MKWPWQKSAPRSEPTRFDPIIIGGPTVAGVDFSTSELNVNTDTWVWIVAYCEDRLKGLRAANDSPAKTELQTANIRGRIAMCKEILGLADKQKVIAEPQPREIY